MKPPQHKAAFSLAAATAALLLDLANSGVSGAALPESHAYVGPRIQIKADGNAVTHSLAQVSIHRAEEAAGDVATDSRAQEHISRAGEDLAQKQQAQKLMRTGADEIRSTPVSKLEEAASQKPLREVDCSTTAALDPVSNNFCSILDGNNWQVSGKLERAVKKMHSLATGVGKDVEHDTLLQTLQGALWELWFCAKRISPKCFPSNSTEEKYEVARHQVWSALAEMKKRAGVTPTRPPGPRVGIPAAVNLELSATTVGVKDVPSTSQPAPASKEAGEHVHLLQHTDLATAGHASILQTGDPTQDAEAALNLMLSPPNALHNLDNTLRKTYLADTAESGTVTIHEDEAGNLKKFKDNLLILHECASMPDCPADHCCNPSDPQEEKYAQAYHRAYEAFIAIQADERLDVQMYLDIVGAIASTTTYYGFDHALHTSTTPHEHVEKVVLHPHKVIEQTVIEEDGTLKKAIVITSGLVVVSVLVLIAMSLGGKTGSKKPKPSEETEDWGEEGYAEEQDGY